MAVPRKSTTGQFAMGEIYAFLKDVEADRGGVIINFGGRCQKYRPRHTWVPKASVRKHTLGASELSFVRGR